MTAFIVLVSSVLSIGQLDPLSHVGTCSDELLNPAGVAVMADGGVLVSDLGGDHIARFDSDGMLIGTWPIPEGPIAVAVHPTNGNYYVSLRDEGTVGIYTYDGNTDSLVRSSPGSLSEGNPMVNFVRPTDMDIASNSGRIYVIDAGGDRVYGFEANGDLALMFGERGELMGQFLYPSAIAVDEANGRLIVADQDNFRIQVFTTSGIFERRFGYRMKYVGAGQEGWMPRTQGLAVDAAGHIYVADALMSTVRVFDAAGSELGQVVGYGFGPGDLRAAFGLDLNGDDSRLYVVSSGTCSVEIYQGRVLGHRRRPARVIRNRAPARLGSRARTGANMMRCGPVRRALRTITRGPTSHPRSPASRGKSAAISWLSSSRWAPGRTPTSPAR